MYLGIDLGTSGVKALLMDEHQHIVASAQSALEVTRLHPGWSEQAPAHWIDATTEAISSLAASHAAQVAAVRGIGLSGQQHGATLLDEHDAVLRPCILWNDTRSHVEVSAMDADPVFREVSGNICFPGFTAPKLAWVRNNEPHLFERARKVLLPKDYLRLWLRMIATAIGVPVDVPAEGDFGAAFGAARLGLLAAEDVSPHSACTAPAIQHTIEPDAALKGAFGGAYARYRALYPAIKGAIS